MKIASRMAPAATCRQSQTGRWCLLTPSGRGVHQAEARASVAGKSPPRQVRRSAALAIFAGDAWPGAFLLSRASTRVPALVVLGSLVLVAAIVAIRFAHACRLDEPLCSWVDHRGEVAVLNAWASWRARVFMLRVSLGRALSSSWTLAGSSGPAVRVTNSGPLGQPCYGAPRVLCISNGAIDCCRTSRVIRTTTRMPTSSQRSLGVMAT